MVINNVTEVPETDNNHADETELTDHISGAMPTDQIIGILGAHSCDDITTRIILADCSKDPEDGGGWGDIYKGKLDTGPQVAIKCARHFRLPKGGKNIIRDAAKELYAWSKCEDANVVTLLGVAQFRGQLAMVSAWMNFGHVTAYLALYPTSNRFLLCAQIASGLAYLHRTNITHGDVKGQNVLVSDEGVAKLTDFGSSIIKNQSIRFSSMMGQSPMSLNWTAPEILLNVGQKVCEETDVFSLGMTFFEVITGKIPFGKDTPPAAVLANLMVTNRRPLRPECCIPSKNVYSNNLWQLIENCWAVSPATRPPAATVVEELNSIKEHMTQCLCTSSE